MADPQHVPELDGFDRLTVQLYRAGLVLAAVGLVVAGIAHLAGASAAVAPVWLVVTLGAGLAVLDMHLYDKRVRWFIQALAWAGVLLQLAAPMLGGAAWVVLHAGLGFVFAALSGFALKEQFCFRVPGLRLVPVMLAASLVPLLLGEHLFAGALLAAAGAIYVVLALAKLRMPLHFDVGDKSRYQI